MLLESETRILTVAVIIQIRPSTTEHVTRNITADPANIGAANPIQCHMKGPHAIDHVTDLVNDTARTRKKRSEVTGRKRGILTRVICFVRSGLALFSHLKCSTVIVTVAIN